MDREGVIAVGDTVRTVPGESRSAHGADFYDGLGIVSGYRQATSDRPLMSVHWLDGEETEALEVALELVERNDDVMSPPERWERLRELGERS